MMKIRSAQVFSLSVDDTATEPIEGLLRERFPEIYEGMGEPGAHKLLLRCLERAARHRLVSQRDVYLFCCVAFLFGEDFDERMPWAKAVLSGPEGGHAGRRSDRLLFEARRHEHQARSVA